MITLDNPTTNACFGCGPANARGLHLAFSRDGDAVVCEYTPKPDETGWPGLFHTGLLLLVLNEACFWGAWELSGAVATLKGPSSFEIHRVPRVGVPFGVRATMEKGTGPAMRMKATAETAEGKPVATLDAGFEHLARSRVAKAGLALPDYVLRDMVP